MPCLCNNTQSDIDIAFWILYFLCSAIRSNVGLAQTMNSAQGHDLSDVLNLTPKQVSTGLALFYVCYVIFDCPSNLIMSKLSPHVWMSRIVLSVGIIGTCMTAMKAAWSLYLLRLLLGIVIAGMWPGMTYYLSLYYPPSRCARRIGHYYTAAQLSAAVVGLVSAGFQKMDGLGGLVGFQWMFLIYGLLAVILGVVLLWWLPDRPHPPGEKIEQPVGWRRLLPRSPPVLTGEDARIHYEELTRVYHRPSWGWKDLGRVLIDWRLWPLVIMYFGVVGVGTFSVSFVMISADRSTRHWCSKLWYCHYSCHQSQPEQYQPVSSLRTNLDHGSHCHPPHHPSQRSLPHSSPRHL